MIIVFGSLNVDFVICTDTLPRPGETVTGGTYFTAAGGKGGNQACASALLGGQVAMVGTVGTDQWAEIVLEPLREAGVDISRVSISNKATTGCALIMVDKAGENAISVASGANSLTVAEQVAGDLLGSNTLLVAQMETPPEETWRVFRRARQAGARTLLNVAPVLPDGVLQLDLVDYLVVNEIELQALAEPHPSANIEETAQALSRKHKLACIVTLGGEGVLCVDTNHVFRVPAKPIEVIDTTGAGDMFIGAMAEALDRGTDLEAAVTWACAAAALACTRMGATPSYPDRAEVLYFLKSD
jgi:ribokinase